MTGYEKIFDRISDMNVTHLETLAVAIYSTLNDLPMAAFEEIAALGKKMGAARLADFHEQMTVAA